MPDSVYLGNCIRFNGYYGDIVRVYFIYHPTGQTVDQVWHGGYFQWADKCKTEQEAVNLMTFTREECRK